MKRFASLLFLISFVCVCSVSLVGCGAKAANDKPLTGLVIQKLEIVGDQSEIVATAIVAALLANGAQLVNQPTPGAVTIGGISYTKDALLVKPAMLSVILSSNKGIGLAATVAVSADDVGLLAGRSDYLNRMAQEAGRQVVEQFAVQWRKHDDLLRPPEKKVIGGGLKT